MHDIETAAQVLQTAVQQALERMDFVSLERRLVELNTQMNQADFWQDNQQAQDIVKQHAKLEKRLQPWHNLQKTISDLLELVNLGDESLATDLQAQLIKAQAMFDSLRQELKFSGPYDDHDAIVSIYAGAGGTDAQDWAQMLLRMYTRWTETNGYMLEVLDESAGDEAGIKSATLEISGEFVYGKLKGEHGVHRLVRLSPYNADNLRQTSFAKVDVLPKINQPDELVIDPKELRIDVYRSGGHGGQSVNTTDSAVRITHLPTNITVAIQNERSQLQNKETAFTILRSKLAQMQLEQHLETLSGLKGPSQSAEWGNQIRSYVLHPYKQVKDLRTKYETTNPDAVLNGDINELINAYLDFNLKA